MAGNVILHFCLQVHHPNFLKTDILDEIRYAVTFLEGAKAGQRPLVAFEGNLDLGFDDRTETKRIACFVCLFNEAVINIYLR